MQPRHILILILALTLLGGIPAVAQDATTTIVAGQPDELTAGIVELVYGDTEYVIDPGDGPVLAYVDAVIETEAGVEVVGTLLVHDATGWKVVGAWLDPAPSEYAEAIPGMVLPLALPERLGAGQ